MTPEQASQLNLLINSKARNIIEHASLFTALLSEMDTETQEKAFIDILTRFKLKEPENETLLEGTSIPLERQKELHSQMGMLISATLNYILNRRMPVDQVARELVRLLGELKTDEEKTYCMTAIMGSNIIPYAILPDFQDRLTNEEYQEEILGITDNIAKLRMASAISNNASDMADLVLTIVESETDRRKKVALLSYFILLRERTVTAAVQQANAQE